MNSTKSATLALWVTLTFLLGSGLLVMKNQVQTLENRLVSINKGIEDDIKTIHILQAEWSHLNSPSRLRKLAEKHISLNPVRAEQIINYSQVPLNTKTTNLTNGAWLRKIFPTMQPATKNLSGWPRLSVR